MASWVLPCLTMRRGGAGQGRPCPGLGAPGFGIHFCSPKARLSVDLVSPLYITVKGKTSSGSSHFTRKKLREPVGGHCPLLGDPHSALRLHVAMANTHHLATGPMGAVVRECPARGGSGYCKGLRFSEAPKVLGCPCIYATPSLGLTDPRSSLWLSDDLKGRGWPPMQKP